MFTLNGMGYLDPLKIYLSRPDEVIICELNEFIDESSADLSYTLNSQYQLSFDIYNDRDFLWFDYLQGDMYLFVEKFGFFKLDQPTIDIDENREVKHITAYSKECELENNTVSLELNMGTKTSYEMLIQYDANETELLTNPYTGLPYDYLVVYNTFDRQLLNHKNKLLSGYYGNYTSGNSLTITNSDLIEELEDLYNLIPRLKHSYSQDDTYNEPILTTYVEYGYANMEETHPNSITLNANYIDRINKLITFYARYKRKLSLLSVVLESTGHSWGIGNIYGVDNGDYTLANKRFQFDTSENVYSFLTQTFAEKAESIVSFDILNGLVNVTPIKYIGEDTGIFCSYTNLVDSLNISCDENRLTTRLRVNGADGINITSANFGSYYIDDLSYKMNVTDNDGNHIYVSQELAWKYEEFVEFRESKRLDYVNASKEYGKILDEISELKYRVPNDSVQTDWGTFPIVDLQTSLITFKNLFNTCISLYREKYGDDLIGNDGYPIEAVIKRTEFWYDYYAYRNTIKQIECAIATYPHYDDKSQWTNEQLSQYENSIRAWETEWSLYGSIELQAKVNGYKSNLDALIEGESVILANTSTYVAKTWSQLSIEEKSLYSGLEANYYYEVYKDTWDKWESSKSALNSINSKLEDLELNQRYYQDEMQRIAKSVSIENYFGDNAPIIYRMFRDADYTNDNIVVTSLDTELDKIDIAHKLVLDGQEQLSKYCRPQLIFEASIDEILSVPEFQRIVQQLILGNYVMVEYSDGTYVKLRIIGYNFNPCNPQSKYSTSIKFSNIIRSKSGISDMDSLLGLSNGVGSSGSGSSSNGNSGKYGESDDIDVTISNTMLAKLLSSETFGTRVKDIILNTVDVKSLTARYATFGGLASGTTTIDGSCIQTGLIKSNAKNSSNNPISWLNLNDGSFSFGDNKLKYDTANGLVVNGNITATTGRIGNWVIDSTGIYKDSKSTVTTDTATYRTKLGMDNTFNPNTNIVFGVRKTETDGSQSWITYLRPNGYFKTTNAEITGKLIAQSGSDIGGYSISTTGNTGTTANGGHAYTKSLYTHSSDDNYEYEVGMKAEGNPNYLAFYVTRINKGNQWTSANRTQLFYVTEGGSLYAKLANIEGTITSSSGTIGGFTLNSNGLTKTVNGFRTTISQNELSVVQTADGKDGLDDIHLGLYTKSGYNTPSLWSNGELSIFAGSVINIHAQAVYMNGIFENATVTRNSTYAKSTSTINAYRVRLSSQFTMVFIDAKIARTTTNMSGENSYTMFTIADEELRPKRITALTYYGASSASASVTPMAYINQNGNVKVCQPKSASNPSNLYISGSYLIDTRQSVDNEES